MYLKTFFSLRLIYIFLCVHELHKRLERKRDGFFFEFVLSFSLNMKCDWYDVITLLNRELQNIYLRLGYEDGFFCYINWEWCFCNCDSLSYKLQIPFPFHAAIWRRYCYTYSAFAHSIIKNYNHRPCPIVRWVHFKYL